MTAFALAGVSNWVAFWYPRHEPAPQQTPQQTAEALAEIALGGVVNVRQEPTGERAVPQALALLRKDLQRLEHLLDSDGGAAMRID